MGGEGDEAEHADYLLHIEGKIDKKSPAHNLWQVCEGQVASIVFHIKLSLSVGQMVLVGH